jgi:MSHA biogenesis protein MshM
MYHTHFGLSEAPFRITPHTEFFYSGAQRGPLLDALIYAITRDEGIIKVSGEVGTGKTMLCRMLMERLPLSVESIYIANPLLTPDDVLQSIAHDLGCVLPGGARGAHLNTLQEHLIGLHGDAKRVVVLVDEAHAMPPDTLEEIRLLSNLETQRHKLLHIVLFGQPELDVVLNRVTMRQLKDRITQHFALTPLTRIEVAAYLDFRMRAAGYRGPDVFSDAAIRRIARASGGLTRRINILADKALLAAFAAGKHAVGAGEAAAAIRDADLRTQPKLTDWRWLTAAGALVVAAAVAFSSQWTKLSEQVPAERPSIGDRSMAAASALPSEPPSSSGATATEPLAAPGNAELQLETLIAETTRWLSITSDHRWFLQLLTTDVDNAGDVERIVARAADLPAREHLRVYRAKVGDAQRLGLIYGDYATAAEARRALQELPAFLRRPGIYPRQVARLR